MVLTVCFTIFTVNLGSLYTVRQIIDSSHNGTVPVQDSSNQQQQDDELRCDLTGSDVQEVRRRKKHRALRKFVRFMSLCCHLDVVMDVRKLTENDKVSFY